MRRSFGVILLFALLIFTQLLLPHNLQAQTPNPVRIGIDIAHGNLHVTPGDLADFTSLLNANEAQILYSDGALNRTYLNSIDVFIISSPQINFTSTEIIDLTGWFNFQGRLWLSASYENVNSMQILNTLLQATGSELRFEYGYAIDPLYNLNATSMDSDQVILPIINHLGTISTPLTTDLRTLYAYRPIPVISTNITGGYTQFNATLAQNATWIAETSSAASVLNSSSTQLLAYTKGSHARIPVSAVENMAASKLAVTGAPFFSQWMQVFNYNQTKPHDDRILTRNLLSWLTRLRITSELEVSLPEIRGTKAPSILIYTGSLSLHSTNTELQPLTSLLTELGFNAQLFSEITFTNIKNATAIIIQTPQTSLTSNETGTLKQWMQQGDRTLLLASMADYTLSGNATQSFNLNGVLSALQSSLRFEEGSLYDPEVNLGGDALLTLSSNLNHISPKVTNLTSNTRTIYLQFATILTGSNQTNFLPLENQTVLNSLTNVTWIAKTSNQSYVYDLDTNIPMQIHKEGQKGSYIVAALERYRADKYNDTIFLTGGPIFSDFSRLLEYPTLFGYPTDNLLLLRNLLTRLLKQTEIKTQLGAIASPNQLPEGGSVTLTVQYDALFKSASNLTEEYRVPISPANITMSLAGGTLTSIRLPNQTYAGSGTAGVSGSTSWSVTAAARGYQSQSSMGTVQVNALPTRFAPYVLSIPIVVFIAVTIAVVARKTR